MLWQEPRISRLQLAAEAANGPDDRLGNVVRRVNTSGSDSGWSPIVLVLVIVLDSQGCQ
jgi:hypothetical protein